MKSNSIKLILGVVIVVFVSYIISNCFFQLALISGNSMTPTLKNNQLVIINKYRSEYKKGAIIAFKNDKTGRILTKRIVGVPKDNITIKKGYLYVNNEIPSYYKKTLFEYEGLLSSDICPEGITLMDNEYVVLGDNIEESIDSRYGEIAIVKKDDIIGIIKD